MGNMRAQSLGTEAYFFLHPVLAAEGLQRRLLPFHFRHPHVHVVRGLICNVFSLRVTSLGFVLSVL
jgi:hypothetical protein